MTLEKKIELSRLEARLRKIRYDIAMKMPKRMQPPMTPSKEMLEECGHYIGDNTYLYRMFEYYVDPIDNEVVRVIYGDIDGRTS